jgi:hypothetical protein
VGPSLQDLTSQQSQGFDGPPALSMDTARVQLSHSPIDDNTVPAPSDDETLELWPVPAPSDDLISQSDLPESDLSDVDEQDCGSSAAPTTRPVIDRVVRYSERLRHYTPSRSAIHQLVTRAFAYADLRTNAEVAAAWGRRALPDGIPSTVVSAHNEELASFSYDLAAMATARMHTMRPRRLNSLRIARLSIDNPERARLLDLAHGMEIWTPPGFYPNSSVPDGRPPIRSLYRRARPAVDALLYQWVEQGLAFTFSLTHAERIRGLHLSPAHWAIKHGKDSGRALIDPTDRSSKHPVLNSDAVAEWAAGRYGVIEHPTI